MDVENIAGEAESKWYGLDGKDLDRRAHPERAGFLIKNLTPGLTRELRKQAMQFVWTGQRTVPIVDEDILHKLMLHECVLDWCNLDRGDEEFPCNRENLEWMDNHSSHFNQLWQAVAQKENVRKDGKPKDGEPVPPKDPAEVSGELGNLTSGEDSTSPIAPRSESSTASPASEEKSQSKESDATGSSPRIEGSAP